MRCRCPACDKLLRLPHEALGRRMRCPACQKVFRTRAPRPAPTAPAAPEPAAPNLMEAMEQEADNLHEAPAGAGPPRPTTARVPSLARCPHCQASLPGQATFCTSCGTDLKTGRRALTRDRNNVYFEKEEVYEWAKWVSLLLPVTIPPIPYKSTVHEGRPSPTANTWLVIGTVLFSGWLLVSLWGGDEETFLRFALWPGARFEFIQTVTHIFVHGGILHLLGNMLFLWMFGAAINHALGTVWFLLTYVLLGILSGLIGHNMLVEETVPLVGASGAIAGLTGMYLVLFPRHDVHLAFWFRPIWWLPPYIRTFAMTGIFAVLLFIAFDIVALATGLTGNVAHGAHLAGFISGIVVGLVLLLTGLVRSQGYDLLTWIMGNRWQQATLKQAAG